MRPVAALLARVRDLPPGTLVPAAWVAAELEALAPTLAAGGEVLDVAELARRWKRSRSAVRTLLEAGQVAGAWKHGGKAWRVRLADVEAFERAQVAPAPLPGARDPSPGSVNDPTGLRALAAAPRPHRGRTRTPRLEDPAHG